MCAARRGIDERDYRYLTGIGSLGANLRIVMSSMMRKRNRLIASSVMGMLVWPQPHVAGGPSREAHAVQ